MDVNARLALSYYEYAAPIRPDHGVFLVRHRETGKFYVKKVLPVYNLSVYRQLRAQPVRGVPRIAELAEDGQTLIVIEEYLQGDTLQEILERQGRIPEAEVLDWTLQLCGILAGLHALTPPIIHRDIKPSNVILSPDGVLRLLDFNAARLGGRDGSSDTTLLGTRGYAAPEQYGFGVSDARTDFYAVGVLMNALLTGEVSHACRAVGSLAPVIEKCLQMDPKERYASAGELADALKKAVSKEAKKSPGRFLPPGFRCGKLSHALPALCGYALIFYVAATLTVDGAGPAELLLNRLFAALTMLSVVFFSFNYLNVWSRLPLCKSRHRPVRLLGVLLFELPVLLFFPTVLVIIKNAWL